MKKKKFLSILLASAMCMGAAFACAGFTACKDKDKDKNPPAEQDPPADDTPTGDTSVKFNGKIYVVGDSTVCDFVATQGGDNYYLNRYGYGTQLYNYINCESNQIINLALSGRSSKSFYNDTAKCKIDNTKTYYGYLKDNISSGDYLIIGFGHNDEKAGDATFASAKGSTATEGSFKYNLNEYYIKLATEKGATPILCTPIVRYDNTGSYTGSKIHVTGDGDYSQAIKDLGTETGTAVVDLTTLTKDIYKADNAAAANFHAHTSYKLQGTDKIPDGRDDTHINMYGAKMVSYQFAKTILNSNCSLKNHIKTTSTAPTYEKDFAAAVNTGYTKPDYSAPILGTAMATTTTNDTTAQWHKSAFGDITDTANFTVGYSENKFTISNTGGNGKFASSSDGFATAFTQIGVNKVFTISAKVKIISKASSANNQAAFGIMLRDDMYINTVSKTINSNFISASALGDGSASFLSRTSSTSLTKKSQSIAVAEGAEYEISLTRVDYTYTATVKTLDAQGAVTAIYTEKYIDYYFNSVDDNYMYLCLFANRGLVAEFSNVQFEITGESQGA